VRFIPAILCAVTVLSSQTVHAQFDPYSNPQIRQYIQGGDQRAMGFYDMDMSVPSGITQEGVPGDELDMLLKERQLDSSQILFDYKIDPARYILGPGDELGIYFWGEIDKEFRNTVSPEGLLILPTVGSIEVADMTLEAAIQAIKEQVDTKYNGLDITVFLVQPRQFRLYISGLVLQPGMISANANERVSDIVDRVGLMYAEQTGIQEQFQDIETLRDTNTRGTNNDRRIGNQSNRDVIKNESSLLKRGSSQREIQVIRGDDVIRADLVRFNKLGDIDANPYVTSGDQIRVLPYKGDLFVYGEVNDPGRYEFKEGDRIKDLVAFGGGLTVMADTLQATLVRFENAEGEAASIDVNLYDALFNNPDAQEYQLLESDRLFVRQKFNYKVIAQVVLEGQVLYPGEYSITPGVTTLSEIIRRAGGFTEHANLEEARLIRTQSSMTQDLEYDRLRRMSRFEMTDEEYDYYRALSRSRRGEITTNFVSLFVEGNTENDVALQNLDQIYVPYAKEMIRVSGAVNNQGYINYDPQASVNDYIERAGGFKFDADRRKMRIIKARTGQRFKPGKNVVLEGGDSIHVPEKTPIDSWQLFMEFAQVFGNVATIILLARQISN